MGALLKELPAAGGYDLFEIEPDDGMYCVRGQFAERAFRKHARQLAALFMSASQVDIRGDVYFLGKGVREGYAVQLSGGRPILATLEAEEIDRRSRDPMLDAISDHFRVAPQSTPPRPPPPYDPSSPRPLLRFPRGGGVEADPDDPNDYVLETRHVRRAKKLVTLSVSPWSERARWALDHHGLVYEVVPHMPILGERRLRRIVGPDKPRATVPVLFAGSEVLTESWDIAVVRGP